ncbi:unnamed protein product [Trichobilharzia szidati]|nr:unnamed protein product [Trichobilharzia szidati]
MKNVIRELSIVWIDETENITQHQEFQAEDNRSVQKHLSIESQEQFCLKVSLKKANLSVDHLCLPWRYNSQKNRHHPHQ